MPVGGLLDLEEVFSLDPTVTDRLVPGLPPSLTDDHVEAVVLQIQRLSRSLNSISENRDRLVSEVVARPQPRRDTRFG